MPSQRGKEATVDSSVSTLSIEARPMTFTIDPSQCAVIVVDMQNEFASEGGAFARAGLDIVPVQNIVAPIARVLAAARDTGMKVIYLKMSFRPDLSDVGVTDSKNWSLHASLGMGEPVTGPDGQPSRLFIQDTWNTEILSELAPQPSDIVVTKHRFSGFYGTDLDVILRGLGIKYLVFTGCTTSVCVESTLRDAMFRDYLCLLLADCAAEPIGQELARSNHEASLLVAELMFGWVSKSAALIEALEAQAVPAER
jgi:ureidoacrylate peracid hydrolase